MPQPGYFSCEGCGRVFNLIGEDRLYDEHICEETETEDSDDIDPPWFGEPTYYTEMFK